MYRKKKISDVTEPTQPEREKRFVRQNSYCSLTCRSNSLRKSAEKKSDLSGPSPHNHLVTKMPVKNHTQSLKLSKNPEEGPLCAFKEHTISMKFGRSKLTIPAFDSCELAKESQAAMPETDQVRALKSQLQKAKVYFNQQREKRKSLEEELLLSKQQVKRLQKRLQKHINEKQRLKAERQFMLKHIDELQKTAFLEPTQILHSFRLKCLEEEVRQLRQELQKRKSQRQLELTAQIEDLREQKFNLQKQLTSAMIGKNALQKQLEEADIEIEDLRRCMHQKVVRSAEYVELRERYRILLTQSKWLKQEIEHLQKLKGNEGASMLEATLLTVSADSIQVE